MKIVEKVNLYLNICNELKSKNLDDFKKLLEL